MKSMTEKQKKIRHLWEMSFDRKYIIDATGCSKSYISEVINGKKGNKKSITKSELRDKNDALRTELTAANLKIERLEKEISRLKAIEITVALDTPIAHDKSAIAFGLKDGEDTTLIATSTFRGDAAFIVSVGDVPIVEELIIRG